MKPLRRLLDRLHPHFTEGGKLQRFYPLYEAIDTFLYTPGEVTSGKTHVRDGLDVKRMMSVVIVALLPCVFMALWNTGRQANNAIRNRRVAELLSTQDVLTEIEVDRAMEFAINKRFEEVAPSVVVDQRVAGEQVESEQREQAMKQLSESIDEVLQSAGPLESISLSQIGYETGWRGRLFRSVGLEHDPDSFWANLIYGATWFLPAYLVTIAAGGIWEGLFAVIRGHDLTEGFLVTSLLFPLTLPPTTPLWQVALGISFGVVFGKEIFGGVGKNFLNPALTARAFLYFAYPAQATGDAIWTAVDGFTGPTTLGVMATADPAVGMEAVRITWWEAFLGTIQGSMGETSALACILGAAVLILTRIGSWRIMVGMLAGGLILSTATWLYSSETNPMFAMPPHWHLVVGGFAFGLVFMATDPVSASMTETGKYIYGFLIGVMSILVRVVNPAFPEGVMLAILFGNVFAPLIDYFVVQANIRRRMARNAA